MTTVLKKGFWVSMPDSTGAKSGLDIELSPAPTRVDYPSTELGEQIETADGRVIVQMPSRDPRRRTWLWSNFGPEVRAYEVQYRWLESLRSRVLQARGIGPYVYVYDGTTNLLNRGRSFETTVSTIVGSTLTVPDLTGEVHPTTLKFAVVDALLNSGSWVRYSVNFATATTLVLDQEFVGILSAGNVIRVSWIEPAWWRVRVLDTSRVLRGDGGSVRYSESKFTFVVEDYAGNPIPAVGEFGTGTVGGGGFPGGILALAFGGTGANLTALADGTLLMVDGGQVVGAVEDTNYLDPGSAIEGGSYTGV